MSQLAPRACRPFLRLAALLCRGACYATWCVLGTFATEACAAERAQVESAAVEKSDAAPTSVRCRSQLRPGDELWLLSTRHLAGCASPAAAAAISVHQRLDADGRSTWQSRSLAELFAADPRSAVVVYVHGNRVTSDDAVTNAWRLYQTVVVDDSPSVRLVVWSWPSERVRGPLRDVRSKAARAGDEAHYFGWTVRQFASEQPIGVYGYSFGARVVTGGLHLAAGGELDGQTLTPGSGSANSSASSATPKKTDLENSPTSDERSPSDSAPSAQNAGPRFSVVLAAAAEHDHWLQPTSLHGRALEPVERLFVLYNSCDPALARYRLIDRCERPVALGSHGIDPATLGGAEAKVTQRDAASSVGRTHDEAAYVGAGMTPEELRRYLLPAPAAAR